METVAQNMDNSIRLPFRLAIRPTTTRVYSTILQLTALRGVALADHTTSAQLSRKKTDFEGHSVENVADTCEQWRLVS